MQTPLKILILEKDQQIRSNWGELLEFFKHYIVCRKDLQGLSRQEVQRYDVIIADVDLVGVDGFELKSICNNDEIRIPIIFVSAGNFPTRLLELDEIAGVLLLRKPFSNTTLLEHIDKARDYLALIQKNADASKPLARLLIEQEGKLPIDFLLIRSYTIGRGRITDTVLPDIRLDSSKVSRKHAMLIRIFAEDSSYYKIIDYSSNGLEINKKKARMVEVLKHGDVIEIPDCLMTYSVIDRKSQDLDQTLTTKED